jgi:predicted nucleic acid-binding Zn ribbon protein
MPIHEFLCTKGHKTEKLFMTLKEADVGFIICPICEETAMKTISAGAFVLGGKRDGWYKPSPSAKVEVNPDSVSFSGDGYTKTN